VSLVKSYAVFCDRMRLHLPEPPGAARGNGCYSWPGEEETTSQAARARARRQGWKRVLIDGRRYDLCPNCAPQLPKEEVTRDGSR
jgi:hypothetical protein